MEVSLSELLAALQSSDHWQVCGDRVYMYLHIRTCVHTIIIP